MKKLLPPTLLKIFIVIMIVMHYVMPVNQIIVFPYNLFGIALIIIGLTISMKGSRLFTKLGTNIKTFDDPDKLVTEGLFKISRNPMYLGFIIFLTGISIALGSVLPFALTFIFFLITDLWYIKFEEKMMLKKFGNEYIIYKMNTRKWL